jgi:hypothetical protein
LATQWKPNIWIWRIFIFIFLASGD